MRKILFGCLTLPLITFGCSVATVFEAGSTALPHPSLVTDVEPSPVAEPDLDALRAKGRDGLRELETSLGITLPLEHKPEASVANVLDAVGGARDTWASGLYWYHDLNDALAEAQRTKKPVLSLRLLGRLDDRFC